MRNIYTFFKHELCMMFSTPALYLVSAAFLSLVLCVYSYLIFAFVQDDQVMPLSVSFFKCSWLPVIFFIPLTTMRVFSEDYRSGMLRNMLTTRLNIWQIVFGKFAAVYVFFEIIIFAIFLFFQLTKFISPAFSGDASFSSGFEVFGGIIFLSILGFFYLSIGLLCSALTENQVVAGMLTFVALFGLLIFGQYMTSNSTIINIDFQKNMSMFNVMMPFVHIDNFCAGVLDSRPIMFYISAGICTLCITKYIVQNKIK